MMVRRLGIWMLCSAAPAIAAADEARPPWEGYWARNAVHCAQAGQAGDGTPDWYGRDGLFGVEWSCDIDRVQPTGMDRSWVLNTTCLDAGFEFTQAQIFLITPDDRLLIIDETGMTANMVRCEGGQK